MDTKPTLASVFLSGCFGCHMSLLDIDERIFDLVNVVDLSRSPLTDIKECEEQYTIGYIEGGCATEENVHMLMQLRTHCDILIAVGECAIQGDIPSLRNMVPLRECFEAAYLQNPSTYNPEKIIPGDPQLPLLLDRVYPCHEVVSIDHFIPGCPPSADSIWLTITSVLNNKSFTIPYRLLKYD